MIELFKHRKMIKISPKEIEKNELEWEYYFLKTIFTKNFRDYELREGEYEFSYEEFEYLFFIKKENIDNLINKLFHTQLHFEGIPEVGHNANYSMLSSCYFNSEENKIRLVLNHSLVSFFKAPRGISLLLRF